MVRVSAGILLYRRRNSELEVVLVHPGGPYFAARDEGVWSIPKGEPNPGEELLDAARREFTEETGFVVPGPFAALTPVVQRGGKHVHAWAATAEWDPETLVSNVIAIEYPPRSGRLIEIPEVDRAAWFAPDQARRKMNPAQATWLDELPTLMQRLDGER